MGWLVGLSVGVGGVLVKVVGVCWWGGWWSIGGASVECWWSVGGVLVECRLSVGRVLVEYR